MSAAADAAAVPTGTVVAVVGPSGAGKDTLLALAAAALAGEPGFHFPRRLVTRPPNPAEDHDCLSAEGFEAGVATEAYALHWRAHGLGYAVPRAAADALASGQVVVCNLSRRAVADARAAFGRVRTVLVTAPDAVLAARIAARGREGRGPAPEARRRAGRRGGAGPHHRERRAPGGRGGAARRLPAGHRRRPPRGCLRSPGLRAGEDVLLSAGR